jgi:2-oxo-4-hydroxy-4-carboxy-5-ureidoimidazoline decarboxylase
VTSALDDVNSLPADRAADVLRACCGASRWVQSMVARRPFTSVDDALSAADEAWAPLGPDDWREAFSHHPRIGERRSAVSQNARGAGWSSAEQRSVDTAGDATRDQLARVNREYETKFGHIYIVCATGKSADELLSIARGRLHNEPSAELRVAAGEQHQITRLRLRKLLSEHP